jgi:hypothetical protein
VLATVDADFLALDVQRFVERYGLEILDCHLFGEGDHVVKLVHLAHGVVEDGGDNAAVAVAGRSGIALAEAELADEGLALFVERELQAHARGIVLAAGEAVVFLQFEIAGVVAMDLGLSWHGRDFILSTEKQLTTEDTEDTKNALWLRDIPFLVGRNLVYISALSFLPLAAELHARESSW